MTTKAYTFRVTGVERVTDGDTYWLRLDVGFRQSILVPIRLLGYDTPEMNSGSAFEKSMGQHAREVAWDWLEDAADANVNPHASLWVRTEKDPDNFGRWLGDLWLESDGDQWPERHLGAELREQGLASVWPVRWRTEFDKEQG